MYYINHYFKVYPGFLLVRYGKTRRHGNDCHQGRSLYSQIPRNRRHGTLQGHTGQESEGVREKLGQAPSLYIFWGKNGQGRLNRVERPRID